MRRLFRSCPFVGDLSDSRRETANETSDPIARSEISSTTACGMLQCSSRRRWKMKRHMITAALLLASLPLAACADHRETTGTYQQGSAPVRDLQLRLRD